MSKLKPCPFCGGGVNIIYSSATQSFNVWHNGKICQIDEPIRLPQGEKIRSLADAYEAWNRRA